MLSKWFESSRPKVRKKIEIIYITNKFDVTFYPISLY